MASLTSSKHEDWPTAEAEQALAPFGNSAAILIEGAHFVADRRM